MQPALGAEVDLPRRKNCSATRAQLFIELSASKRDASIPVGGREATAGGATRLRDAVVARGAGGVRGAVVSITLDILTALAEHPGGEAPIAAVKDRLVQVALQPVRPSGVGQQERPDLLYRYRPRGPDNLQSLFSSGLVERPRPGVWKLTDKGRTFLAGLWSETKLSN